MRTARAERFPVTDQYPEPGSDLFVTDLSKSGACVRTRRLEPVGAQIDVRVTFVDDDLYTLEGIADVVRRDDREGLMGLRFVWLTPESKSVLDGLERRRAPGRRRRRVTPR